MTPAAALEPADEVVATPTSDDNLGFDASGLGVRECERVFRRNGLPMLVDGHSLRRDVFGRAAPFLMLVLVAQMSVAVDSSWSTAANVLAAVGAVVVLVGGYILLNRLRGRPWSTLPQDIHAPELVFFVVAPTIVPLIAGQWGVVAFVALSNVAALVVTWFVVKYGLLSTLWWGLARAVDELGASLLRLVRLLPPLLIFSFVLFYNAEVWQVFDRVSTVASTIFGTLFAVLIVGFIGLRLPSETDAALAAASTGTDPEPLTRGQRINVLVMIGASQLLQVLVVCAGVFAFFLGIGILTVTPDVQAVWDVGRGWQIPVTLDGVDMVLNQSLMRVCIAIATFTGLYFAISIQTDASYRDEFTSGIERQLRVVLRARERYRVLVAAGGA